jgi:multidrug efflux pump subunit AcrB
MTDNSQQTGLVAWFAGNHVAANILMMLFILGGFLSLSQMRTETFPAIDPRLITVTVPYPGATPFEVADSITNRVEEAILGIDGVKRIASTANEGIGQINVELQDFADADTIYNEVETAVNSLSDFPPENAERPIITKVKLTPNVLTLALHGDVTEETLKYWVETIEDDLRALPGIALTTVRGIRDYQISVEVPENALREYGLTLDDISRAINAFSIDTPAGTLEAQQGEISLRVQSRRYTGQEFENTPITTLPDGSTLFLRDIGTVIDGLVDKNLISLFNGKPAAFIDVQRSESEDTLEIAGIAKNYLDSVALPSGLQLALQKDETVNLKDRINLMLRNGVLGFMLVFLVLLLFLDLKLAFWVSVAVPTSFLGGLMIIHFMGYSINMISLFALIVVLGIVVDDAIVTGESIFQAQEENPDDPNATLKGVKNVIAPVTVGVTTTMAAFAPLALSTGTLGQIIGLIPIVVIPILFISLIEAYFILPAHLSNPKRWSKGIVASIRGHVDNGLQWFSNNILGPGAAFFIQWRYVTLAAFIGFAIITIAMMTSGTVRFIFFPNVEADEVAITLTMPSGTPFEETTDTIMAIQDATTEYRQTVMETGDDPFQSITVSIGATSRASGPGSAGGNDTASNIGEVKIQLVPSDFRTVSSKDVENNIRKNIGNLPGIEELRFASSLVGDEPDIEIELTHPDNIVLNNAADELKAALQNIDGTTEVTDSFKEGRTEYVFDVTAEGRAVGLTPAELGRQLRSAFFGLEAQRFQRGQSELIVYVRYPKIERESLDALNQTRIRLANGAEVPLNSVARIKEQSGFSEINTVDGRRVVSITSDVDYDTTTPAAIMEILNNDILPDLKQRYTNLSYSFEGESREQAEDLASLGQNMLIALILIYILLGGQLRSYIQPIIIMAAIPFGVMGAIWGHYLLGADLTFISMFGIVALTGVVVNDSVVLIDYLNKHREGQTLYESCLLAIKRRFRPILLTTLTTSLGLLPMLLETSLQAKFLIPMVISLATGILFVTVIILVLIPILIMILDDIKNMFVRLGNKVTSRTSSPKNGETLK